jgi:hypothetical protein
MKNQAAVALGRMAKGVPKTLTDEQRTFRAQQLAQARKHVAKARRSERCWTGISARRGENQTKNKSK